MPDHARAIRSLQASLAGEDPGDLRGLLGRIERRPEGSENINTMAYSAAVTAGQIDPGVTRPICAASWAGATGLNRRA